MVSMFCSECSFKTLKSRQVYDITNNVLFVHYSNIHNILTGFEQVKLICYLVYVMSLFYVFILFCIFTLLFKSLGSERFFEARVHLKK